jgi:DNA transformation protein and related proteins
MMIDKAKKIATTPQAAVDSLAGLGPKSRAALAAIGIHNAAQLQAQDPFAVYARLKREVPGTSLNFLYALIGAQEGLDWREVQRSRRTDILMRLDDMGLAPK